MKVINFKNFKDVPVCARVIWLIAFLCACVGVVTILLDVFDVYHVKLCVSIAFCTAAALLNNISLRQYKDKLYTETNIKEN